MGVRVDFLTMREALSWVEERVKYNKVGQITTPNPEQVVLAQKDEEFRRVLNNAGLNICDGIGLVWAVKLLGKKGVRDRFSKDCFEPFNENNGNKIGQVPQISTDFAPSRLSGVDLMLEMCRLAGKKGWKVFLLGGKEEAAEKTVETLHATNERDLNPTVETLHATSLPNVKMSFDFGSVDIANETEKERKEVISKINQFKPNLLFVAYGAPWQEKWIARNLPKLKVNVAMGVGGAFDYISGKVGRAPGFVRKIGLEWLWRLGREPWRIKRQLGLVRFLWLCSKSR